MTSTALPAFRLGETRVARFFRDSRAGSPALALHAGLMLAAFVVAFALMQIDDRTLNGANIWHKPAKFFFSLAVQFITVAWAISLLPPTLRTGRAIALPVSAMIWAGWGEMAYIVFRAARGEASHFNTGTLLGQVAYGLMGFGALVLVLTAGWIGLVLWRNRAADIWREAAGLGLMLSTVLTIPMAFYLSSHVGGHWVGGEMSDANGLRLFLWSTTGGDLRIPHFAALHAMQVVPFAALSGSRGVVGLAALAVALLSLALFGQAALGIPLFRL
ncbi:MAG: hypothetical protein JNM45_11865 [Rhizobiales bacterium]|nr:hypothetical protein [Hyphomicrobiales bacterium]